MLVALLLPGLPFLIAIGIEAPSVWTETDFSGGTGYNVYISPDNRIRLATEEHESEDDFNDLTRINIMKNLSHDPQEAKIDIIKNQRTYGGLNSENGKKIRPTADGGYIIVGSTESSGSGNSDVWLIKTYANGTLQWSKSFGGTENDYGKDVRQTADGGYVLTGYTYSFGNGGLDVWLIRTDSNGSMIWNETYGGGGNEYGEGVQQTKDGGFIITGCDYHSGIDPWSELYIIKTDALGSEEWSSTFGNSGDFSWGLSVIQALDDEYVTIGYTESFGNGRKDIWLLKIDGNGDLTWHETFGGPGYERGYSLEQTADDGYILVGYSNSWGLGGNDVWLVKTDENGQEMWNQEFGGPEDDEGYSVRITANGGYIISGSTQSYGAGSKDMWVICTNNTGTRLWDRTYGGPSIDYSESVCTAADEGYMVLGTSYSYGAGEYDMWLIRIEPGGACQFSNGLLVSKNLLGSSAAFLDRFEYSCSIPNGTQLLASFSQDNLTWYDSIGNLGGNEVLLNGEGNLNLSGLNWNTSSFYYRMEFRSPNPESPVLDRVSVTYREFHPSGHFESAFIDNGENLMAWKWLTWSDTRPAGTRLVFQLRSSATMDGIMGEAFLGPDGNSSLYYSYSSMNIWEGHDYHRWLQYKVYLETEDRSVSPFLDDVLITYNMLPRAEVATPAGIQNGTVGIDYLLYDGESDELDIMVEYRIGNSSYREATPGAGGEGVEGLASSPDGVPHSFVWNSIGDLGKVDEDNVFVRITPSDKHTGTPSSTIRFTVDNKAPEFISISPTGKVNSRTVKIVVETDENALVRWSLANQSYELMTNQFTEGEGTTMHKAFVNAQEGINAIYVSAMDFFGNFLTYGARIEFTVDTTAPENISVIINNGDEYTNSPRVNITIMDTRGPLDLYEMRISNDEDFPNATWGPFTRNRMWNLSPGDGRKAVHVELRDSGGNVASFQGSIILDTTPPVFLITGPDTEQSSLKVNITVTTNEGAFLRWSTENSSYYSMTDIFERGAGTTVHSTLVNASRGNNTFYISAVDLHGNVMSSSMPLNFWVILKNGGGGGGGGGNGPGEGEGGTKTEGGSINWKFWVIVLIILNIILFIIVVVNRRRKNVPEETVSENQGRIRKEDLLESLHAGGGGVSTGQAPCGSGYSVSAPQPQVVEKDSLPPAQQKIIPPAASGTTTIVPIDKPAAIAQSALAKKPGAPQSPPPKDTVRASTGVMKELNDIWKSAKAPTVETKKGKPSSGISTGEPKEKRSVDLSSLLMELRRDVPTRKPLDDIQSVGIPFKDRPRLVADEKGKQIPAFPRMKPTYSSVGDSSAAPSTPKAEPRGGRYANKISNSIDFILDKYAVKEEEKEEEEKVHSRALASIPIKRIAIRRRNDTKYR